MDNNYENQEIIGLLKEQNRILGEMQIFLIKRDKHARNMAILRFILAAIPYIALLILVWFLYQSVQEYLNALNNNINAMKQSYDGIIHSIQNIPNEVSNSVQELFKNSLGNTFDRFIK